MTQVLALNLIEAAVGAARRQDASPVSVVVVDEGGHLAALVREAGAAPFSVEMAQAKARAALWLGGASAPLAELHRTRPDIAAALTAVPLTPLALIGGGLTLSQPRVGLAAIGVAGDTPENDHLIAQAAVDEFAQTTG